jgi:branched-chain amino acid transport system ATP-binding protein
VRISQYIYVPSPGEIAAEGPQETFTGDLHDQVRGWLGLNF